MQTLYVTNKWEKPITFSYEYKPYTFPVGQTVEAPEDAVCHIFGYGDPNKEHYMARLALIKTKNDIPDGLKILSKIEISDKPPMQNHLLSPVVERVPLPSKKVGGKINLQNDG
jgi:hypothetical protein